MIRKLSQKFSVRTLRVHILTLFLSLIISAFACVITYSYFRNYTGLQEYSEKTMQLVSDMITEKIQNVSAEVESSLNDSSGLLLYNKKSMAIDNPELAIAMLEIVDFNTEVSSMTLAFPSGNILKVDEVSLSTQAHYMTNPDKPLPVGTVFVVRKIQVSPLPSQEIWTYVDKDYKPLASERLPHITIDLQTRPWYTGALNHKGIYWSDPYYLSGTHALGLGVGKAIYDINHHFLGVIGMNLSFISLSKFLSLQKISRHGKALILDQQGKILIPILEYQSKSAETTKIAAEAWKNAQKNSSKNFIFKYQSKHYLAYIGKLPGNFDKNWFVLITAPFMDFFSTLIRIQLEVALITFCILLMTIIAISFFSKRISNPIVTLAKEIDKITNLNLTSIMRVHSKIVEIRIMDSSIAAMRNALRSFSRYVPKDIVKKLLAQGQDIKLHVDKKNITVLFTDIKDFTTISESYSLDILMPLLNQYFDGLSKIILNRQGTIDKYIGDSIMAFWGAPLENPTHAQDACMTALLCRMHLRTFNKHSRQNDLPVFKTRFGINTGEVLVGNIGTQDRINYTVIGDPVNLAARLQSICRDYHVEIMISDQVHQVISDQFLCRPLDKIAVKGKQHETEIYELVALMAPDTEISATSAEIKRCQDFTRAYHAYVAGDFITAIQLFQAIHIEFPDDHPTKMYLDRLS